ncbi:hypothetical protein CPER28S_01883 [Cellulomonas persica]
MSELTITLLRLGYLALLWVLVLSSIAVLRRDLYGTRITKRRARRQAPVPAGGPVAVGPSTAPTPVVGHQGRAGQGRAGQGRGAQGRGSQRSARLVVTQGPLTGTIVPLGQSAVVVGRAPGCTLVLDDDYFELEARADLPAGRAVVRRGPRLDQRHVRRRRAHRRADPPAPRSLGPCGP